MSPFAHLTAEQWPAVSALLDEALALEPAERDRFVQQLAGERAQFRDTLRALLAQCGGVETDQFLATLPRITAPLDRASGALTELAADQAIGPYRLIRELGAGGMGAVWLAERADGSLKRQVALKMPRLAWDTGLAERMARERDILASLEHPHVARLYDAGVDQHGRPYLALEYVEGEPIDMYAKARALSVRHKLDLLLQVCAAVAFAHSRLVVHRDLKPSNILVTADGQVRLLDFGIAKLMEGDRTQETQLTQVAGRALTRDYASPEQIRGEPIGTASDVYSLGVVAYELLTGAKPYKLKRGSAAELEEAIAAIDAPKASDAATESPVKKALRGDLDAILNKALKKRATDRYATIDALAQDITRHLNSEPVSAQPDALSYRAGKFLMRYRVQVAAAAIASIAVVTGALVAGIKADQARAAAVVAEQQREAARKEADRASAVQSFLREVFMRNSSQQADPIRARATTVRELLDIGAERAATSLHASPEARVEVLGMLSDMYLQLSLDGEAKRLLREGVQTARQAFAPDDPRRAQAIIAYTTTLYEGSDREEIPALHAEARRVLDAAGDRGKGLRGEFLTSVARFERYRSLPRMLVAADEAVAFFRTEAPGSPTMINALRLAARGRLLAYDDAGAEALAAEAVTAARGLGDAAAAWLVSALADLADAQWRQGKLLDAERSYRESLEQSLRANGPDHPATLNSMVKLGSLLLQGGHREDGQVLVDRALASLKRTDKRVPPGLVIDIGSLYAAARFELGLPGDVERYVVADVEDLRATLPGSGALAMRLRTLAEVRLRAGRHAEARALIDEGDAIWRAYAGDQRPPVGDLLFVLARARLALARGDADAALRVLDAARDVTPAAVPYNAQGVNALIERAFAAAQAGRAAEGIEAADRATAGLQSMPSGRQPAVEARALTALGLARYKAGDQLGARRALEQALSLHDEHGQADSLWHMATLDALSHVLPGAEATRAVRMRDDARRIRALHANMGRQAR